MSPDVDPARFATHVETVDGLEIASVREGVGGVPLVCVHGWPETKRIYWRVIEPLAAAGFEVIAPDLRGFGESSVSPDGFHDTAACAADLYTLVHDVWGHERVVLLGGDFGGPVIQHLALAHPEWVDRMVLFNSPLAYDKARMADIPATRAPGVASDYFRRQGLEPDALAAELTTPGERERYIATFYTSRFWAHPDAFDADAVAFHTEPFGDAAHLRASFGPYESSFSADRRSGPVLGGHNPHTLTLILHGPSDHVMYPAFDLMAAVTFPRHVGPFQLRDCGHFVPWEAPHALISGTVAFCSDLLAQSSRRLG